MMKPEAIINVRFLTPDEGGRESPIKSDKYGCPLMINDKDGFDCRFVLNQFTCFELGNDYDIYVQFVNSDIAMKCLREGTEISLWEGKTIAIGKVVRILST